MVRGGEELSPVVRASVVDGVVEVVVVCGLIVRVVSRGGRGGVSREVVVGGGGVGGGRGRRSQRGGRSGSTTRCTWQECEVNERQ